MSCEHLKLFTDQFCMLGLKKHYDSYKANKEIFNKLSDNHEEILSVISYLQSNHIKCLKYNHSLDAEFQQNNNQQATILLSDDGDHLIIRNCKPVFNHKYDLNTNPKIIQTLKQNEKKKRLAKAKGEQFIEKEFNPYDSSISSHCLSELDSELDEIEFVDDHSSTSCCLSDINGIIYGGLSSRFWMLRKHINSLNNQQLKNVPFYSWDCITL